MGDRPGDQLSLRLHAERPRLPVSLRPMLAQPADAPFDSPTHLFEPSWGGERALAFVEPDAEAPPGLGRDLRILDSAGRDVAPLLPELHGLAGRIAGASAVLDGELVVVDRSGRLDPESLARRLSGAGDRGVAYLVFDLLYLDGRPLLGLPLDRRRAMLRATLAPDDVVVPVPAIAGDGIALHAAVAAQGIGGITARERRSPYLPGLRSRLWLAIPVTPEASGDAGQAEEAVADDLHATGGAGAGAAGGAAGAVGAASTAIAGRRAEGDEGGRIEGSEASRGPSGPGAPALALIQRLPFDES